MANIKVRDLADTTNISMANQLMVLTNEQNNIVQNITVKNFNAGIISSASDNGLSQDDNGKLFVNNADSGVVAGTYEYPKNLQVNSKGQILSVEQGQEANVPIATTTKVGAVKPDGLTIEITQDGTISSNNLGNEVGDIIWRLLPSNDAGKHLLDGTLLNAGSYSGFVNRIADLYTNSPKISNVTKIGSLTDNNGVLSGFSTSNYALLPVAINVSTYNWEFVVKINTPDVTTLQSLIGGVNQDYAPFELQLDNGKLKLWLDEAPTAAGNFANGVLSDTTFNINTDYWIKTVFNGTTYVVSYSTDGSNYIDTISVTSSKVIFSDYLAFGLDKYANNTIYSGSIDLKESYININGQRWWTGAQPAWAVNEATWQATVAQYGACGKFVYDSTNKTLRLPKVTGIVEGTIDATALGDLIAAGLPNITGNAAVTTDNGALMTGAFSWTPRTNNIVVYNPSGTYPWGTLTLNASQSSPIYKDNFNKVQPQTILGYYYIVVATSTKTPVQVNIDEIATDLNGKADTDLTNTTNQAKILMSRMAMPSNRFIDLTIGASGATYTAPANGWFWITYEAVNNSTGGWAVFINMNNGIIAKSWSINTFGTSILLPIKKGEVMQMLWGGNPFVTNVYFRFYYAQGSESEAQ